MSNVVSFEEFEDEQEIAAYQIGLPRIVLEGSDDVRLFRSYWFTNLIDSFEFVEAADIVDGGGCTAVQEAVRKSKENNIPAFGITDRDTFFQSRQWASLFAIDDVAFSAAGSGTDLYTTLRWEVEAYLLEPDILPAWLRSHSKPPAPPAVSAKAVEKALVECEQLLRAHRYFATAHHCGVSVSDAFCCNTPASKLVEKCNQALGKLTYDHSIVAEIDAYVDAIIEAAPQDPARRLVWLLRYVDTKRLLRRLTETFRGDPEVRWFLAEMMRAGNVRPVEIESKLLEVRERLAA